MAQRTVCLCDGQYIGIESIYTVINGQQINIPEKLEQLRYKSRHNQLFCPCGCGSNLVLVAGDKNCREQHFRVKHHTFHDSCSAVNEGATSIHSKIVLKCWLEDKLNPPSIEMRVPICSVDSSTQKYEFTFLLRENSLAIHYCYNRNNLSDDKLKILEDNAKDIKIIHVLDIANAETNGQYPEWVMKVQKKQNYCLFLDIQNQDYDHAVLRASYYCKNAAGFWQEQVFAQGSLHTFTMDKNGCVLYQNQELNLLQNAHWKSFLESIAIKKNAQITAPSTTTARAIEVQEKECEAQKQEKEQDKEYERIAKLNFEEQKTQIRDSYGRRWIKCKYCNKIGTDEAFVSYGGSKEVNLGTCYDCKHLVPEPQLKNSNNPMRERQKVAANTCPLCDAPLTKRHSKYGEFCIFTVILTVNIQKTYKNQVPQMLIVK